MLFTHDTEVSLMGAAALVNTMEGSVPGDDDVDRLTTPDELDAFYGSWQWTGSRATGSKSFSTSCWIGKSAGAPTWLVQLPRITV